VQILKGGVLVQDLQAQAGGYFKDAVSGTNLYSKAGTTFDVVDISSEVLPAQNWLVVTNMTSYPIYHLQGNRSQRTYVNHVAQWTPPVPPIEYAHASDFTYTTSDAQVTITGYIGAGGQVNIPPTIGGNPVIFIGDGAFF
jgi:hypothetical protein